MDVQPNEPAKIDSALQIEASGYTFLQELQILLGLWDGNPESPVKVRELPPWEWVPNDRWRALEGILADHPEHDTTEMKRRNLAEEEEHDARKFGWSREH